jgi:cytochrome c-type biogenesis protein
MGPLTLPCTGPLIISAFVLGGVRGTGALGDGLLYFFVFGLGFGWPLVLLPLVAAPVQRGLTRFLTRHHRAITMGSGVLLVGVAGAGWWFDIRPN